MQVPAGAPEEAPDGAAASKDCLTHMVVLAFSPSDPLSLESVFYPWAARYFQDSWVAGDGSFVANPDGPHHTAHCCPFLLVP